MRQDEQMHRKRFVASIAATLISLACGTNYVYSAWAPQFAERLKLSATESNLVGLFGNLGMYSMGVPIGMFVDHRGSRPAVFVGAMLLAVGYFPLHQAYDSATGSIVFFCFLSYLSGLGSCMAFAGAVKTSALNWPHHRGTATAFPLAAFGLSAFFFSIFGALLFPGNPSAFLMLLSSGTFSLTTLGFFFLKVYPHTSYHIIPHQDAAPQHLLCNPQQLQRNTSDSGVPRRSTLANVELASPNTSVKSSTIQRSGAFTEAFLSPQPINATSTGDLSGEYDTHESAADETSSLMSSSAAAELMETSNVDLDRSRRVDIRGLDLLRAVEFWQLFSIMAILAGTGLMTINNIGNDTNALWKHYDSSIDESFLIHHQQMHVSILSVCSFVGRLSSGIGSDFLVKNLHASRIWCLAVASAVFLLAQICALTIENPHLLVFVSSLSGLGYGILFGVFPSIVAESFGIRGLSQNWGFITLAPVASSNVFNLFYGNVYDAHSVVESNGERSCHEGRRCYRAAYWLTTSACFVGFCFTLLIIRYRQINKLRSDRKLREQD